MGARVVRGVVLLSEAVAECGGVDHGRMPLQEGCGWSRWKRSGKGRGAARGTGVVAKCGRGTEWVVTWKGVEGVVE